MLCIAVAGWAHPYDLASLTWPSKAKTNQAKPSQAKPSKGKPSQTKPHHFLV
jgi:hypothetical protein